MATVPPIDPARARRADLLLALLLAVAYGWLFVFFPRINNPNELVRVYMARSIAEQGTYAIGHRVAVRGRLADEGPLFAEWGWVNDRSLVCDDPRLQGPACPGTLYSGKAPGVSLLAAPLVFTQNALTQALLHRKPDKDEYVLALRWLLAILPSIALWLALRRFLLARAVDAPLALAVTLAGACGSLSYTFGQMVAGHQLTGVALAAGFFATFWPKRSGDEARMRRGELARAALTGLALSAAVCIEYQSAPAALLIGAAWLFVRALPHRSPRLVLPLFAALLLGALPFTALLAQFHTAAYGAPWKTGYSFLENASFQRDIAPGFLGISFPTGERIWGSFFSPALGLFFFAPWLALALGAVPLAYRAWRASKNPVPEGSDPAPDPATASGLQNDKATKMVNVVTSSNLVAARAARLVLPSALAVVFYYLAFQSGHALWRSGWTVGPRYITPIVPFAAMAIALALQTLAPAARALGLSLLGGAGAAAILATGLASSVCQGFPDEPHGPLAEIVLPLLAHGWVPRNLLQAAGVPGLWSGLPTFLSLGLAAFLCVTAVRTADAPPRARKLGLGLALAVWALLSLGQWTQDLHGAPWGSAAFLSSQWTPANPPGATPF